MAEDVRLLLDELHIDSAHVVGTSMGGWIAQKLAVARPGRVRTMTLLMTSNGDKSVWKPQPQALEAMSAPAPQERDGTIEPRRSSNRRAPVRWPLRTQPRRSTAACTLPA